MYKIILICSHVITSENLKEYDFLIDSVIKAVFMHLFYVC